MADWTDLSSNFGYGTKLTSTLQQNLRDNITAAFEGASGSPSLANDYVKNTMLDVDYVTVSISNSTAETTVSDCVLTPCGNYGFYPTFSVTSLEPGAAATTLKSQMFNTSLDGISSSSMVYDDGNFSTAIFLSLGLAAGASNNRTFYARQYYVTASGTLKWIFVKRDKITKEIISTYEAWDHPSNRNGYNIEHPFLYYNPLSHDLLCINPTTADLIDQEDLLDAGYNEIDILMQSEIIEDNGLKFPKDVKWENRLIPQKRRIKRNKHKNLYIPEPTNTNIKLARIKFK